jgi:hypothetical protein
MNEKRRAARIAAASWAVTVHLIQRNSPTRILSQLIIAIFYQFQKKPLYTLPVARILGYSSQAILDGAA